MTVKVILLVLTGLAACFDVRARRIPNWLSLGGCLAGVAVNTALTGWAGLQFAALGLFVGFALYLPLWLLGARGAGDVKLLAAVGSLIGARNTLVFGFTAALVGGMLAVMVVVAKGSVLQTAFHIGVILSSLARFQKPARTLSAPDAIRLPHALVIFITAAILNAIRHG